LTLSEGDRNALLWAQRESGGFLHAARWYLRNWEPMPYQYVWHMVPQMNATWVGGIATAKTSTSAASYLMDCIGYPNFKALNTSVTAKQAELPFMMIMEWIEDNQKLEHLIEDIRLKPWPIITFKNYSTYEFRTAGLNAAFIRGFEYDRANYDECGLDTQGKTTEILRGRLRGSRIAGNKRVPRLARLDTVSSPTAALWFKERFNKGQRPETQDLYFSMRTTTWDNIHLTKAQIDAMAAEMPADVILVELGAEFPEYGAAFFPEGHVDACIDQTLYDIAYIALNPEDPTEIPKAGYRLDEDGRAGITLFELPIVPGKRYILAGDPGRGNPPHRNAGVVLVADVTNIPLRLVYCNWVAGNGSINPFMDAYKYAIEKYLPERKGLDVTGTQTFLDEIAFTNYGIATDGINYAADKHGMLNSLLTDILNHRWRIPPVQGLVRQTKTYTLEDDKDNTFPQDLVTTLAQISWLAREMHVTQAAVQNHKTAGNPRFMRPLQRSGMRNPIGRRRR
jgi:hypothetical protein